MAEAVQQFDCSTVIGAVAHGRFNRDRASREALSRVSPGLQGLKLSQSRSCRRERCRNIRCVDEGRKRLGAKFKRRNRVELQLHRKLKCASPEITDFQAGVLHDLSLHSERPTEHLGSGGVGHDLRRLRAGCGLRRRGHKSDVLHRATGQERRPAGAPGWRRAEGTLTGCRRRQDDLKLDRVPVGVEVPGNHIEGHACASSNGPFPGSGGIEREAHAWTEIVPVLLGNVEYQRRARKVGDCVQSVCLNAGWIAEEVVTNAQIQGEAAVYLDVVLREQVKVLGIP